jgi:hypothetical protein
MSDQVIFRIDGATRKGLPDGGVTEIDSNARLSARQRRTPIEWPWVGLRVSDRAGGTKWNIALERRRWLQRKSVRSLIELLRLAIGA